MRSFMVHRRESASRIARCYFRALTNTIRSPRLAGRKKRIQRRVARAGTSPVPGGGKMFGRRSGEPVAVLFSESPRYRGAQCAIFEPFVPGIHCFRSSAFRSAYGNVQ